MLSPAEVRDRVQALGLPPQANLLASIHTTIKRMKEAGEIAENMLPIESGGTAAFYVWQGESKESSALREFAKLHDSRLAKAVKTFKEQARPSGRKMTLA